MGRLDAVLSATESDESDNAKWRTPPEVFAPLHQEFRFGLDAAAVRNSRLVIQYLGPDNIDPARRDALSADWVAPLEEWRIVDTFDDYDISSLGRVRGPGRNGERPILVGGTDKDGYRRVSMIRRTEDGTRIQRSERIATLVARAFIGPRPEGHVVRHLDSDHRNDRAWNLAYGTQQRNIDDRDAAGHTARGERSGVAKLTQVIVDEIRASKLPRRQLSEKYGVSRGCIDGVLTLRNWRPPIVKTPDFHSPVRKPAIYCNPPYGRRVGRWVECCARWGEVMPVVLLIFARTETLWWHEIVMAKATEVRFIKGRVSFLRHDGTDAGPATAPSALIVFEPRQDRLLRLPPRFSSWVLP